MGILPPDVRGGETADYFYLGNDPTMTNILCPTDLSPIALMGVHYADVLATRLEGSITLLHVLSKQELKGDSRLHAKMAMDQQRSEVKTAPVDLKYLEGEFIREIARESTKDHRLMVCATHGLRGRRQSLFGADILKLVRRVEIPTVVVQGHSPESNDFKVIVMPVASHEHIDKLLTAISALAKAFNSTVHIHHVIRPGESASTELLANKVRMMEWLEREDVEYVEVEEPAERYSVGFAMATITYAERVKAGCIAMMSMPSEEYRYIADAEKERLLMNEPGIPVLCAK